MSNRPLIGITIGDPAGIGPEVAVKGAREPEHRTANRVLLIGSLDVLRRMDSGAAFRAVAAPEEVGDDDPTAPIPVLDTGAVPGATPGTLSEAAGVAAAEDTETAVALAMAHRIDAVVSGPINKQGLQLAGRNYPGQTEFIRTLTGAEQPLKILIGGNLRVAQLSSHMPLSEAIRQVTADRVRDTAIRLANALRTDWGIAAPRICVSALNPHAGDNGLLGREELDEINPGVAAARAAGHDVTGAVPSDVAFLHGEEGRYDGVVSLFHDQGTLPLKRLKFASVAHGLPIVRTTPGHGTGYDIAGTGAADATAMGNAIRVAGTLAAARQRAAA
jgi:4-phospho-D-threonate 3-dehydrogenase / 4-phospho-D-erythronate 3-dehydrogenase